MLGGSRRFVGGSWVGAPLGSKRVAEKSFRTMLARLENLIL
jgi:hypothetical protein